jgi:phasin
MIEATIAATKAKIGNPPASLVEKPKYEMPKFGSIEVPAAFREIADKSVAHTKDTYEKAKAATEEATNLFQHTYTAAAKGATDYNLKVIEIARINTNAAFDYAHQLLGVKSLSEFVELSSASARKQFEAMTAQTKELTTLAQKVTIETAEPLKTGVTGAFKKIA